MRAKTSRRTASTFATGAAMLVAAGLVLTGCTSPSSEPENTDAAAPSETATPTPTPTPVLKSPLTGEIIEDDTDLGPSIASKIDNHIAARPQVGLQYTDIVFEELVEGGLTRYVAIWQSQIPKEYGPVRSIRGMDPAIVSSFGGIITYSGGQPVFKRRMENTVVKNVTHDEYGADPEIFFRTGDKSAPHNVIAKGENIIEKFGDDLEAPAQQFPYAEEFEGATAVFAGTPTSVIKAFFSQASQPSWKWSDDKQIWLRSQNGEKDRSDDGKQIRAVNVVTIEVETEIQAHTPVTVLKGTGKASVSTGGKTIEGTWSKGSRKSKLRIVDETGVPILFAPGNTWVELVATGGAVGGGKVTFVE